MAGNVLSTATTSLGAVSSLIAVVPQVAGLFGGKTAQNVVGYQHQNPQSVPGDLSAAPKAILFHYEGEQTAFIESDITDHFVEDNTAIQDQIALKPEMVTTHGFIGELNDVLPSFLAPLTGITQRLGALSTFAPGVTVAAQIAYNTALQLYQTGNSLYQSGVGTASSLSGTSGTSVINGSTDFKQLSSQNKQQSMFQTFYGYWRSRTLFTVQTPWAVFQNMAIKSLKAIQDADSQVITDFEVTFKLIRMASTLSAGAPITSGRLATQTALATQLGTSTPISSIQNITSLF